MTLTYALRGYSKRGDRATVSEPLPSSVVPAVKRIVNDPSDPDLIHPHAVGLSQMYQLAQALGRVFDYEQFDYFVEATADWDTIRHAKRHARVIQ